MESPAIEPTFETPLNVIQTHTVKRTGNNEDMPKQPKKIKKQADIRNLIQINLE